MNSIELKVTKSTMSVSNIYTLNQGEYNVDKCVFDFSDDYNDLIKKAVFIYNEEDPIEMVILDNECNIPYELLQVATEFTLKVYAYEVKNNELVQRYSPTPLKIFLREGSYQGSNEVITPSQFEQYEAKLDEGLDDVADALGEVNTALQTMATATEETNRLNIDVSDKVDKDVTITLTKKDNTTKSVVISDGDDFQYNWDGTRLGVKTDKEESYSYVDLQGQQGPMGPQGEAFQIKKTYTTTQEMIADYDNMEVNDYVMISGSVEQQDNATLWVKTETEDPTYKWVYLADFSGASGIQGPTGATPNIQIGNVTQGDTPNVTRRGTDENPILDFTLVKGDKGNTGNTGPTGNGISSVEKISTSGLVDTYRQTFTNGEHFDYDVTNGADGNVTDVQVEGTSVVDNGVANITGLATQQELDYYKTIYNVLPKVEGNGESITLNNTGESILKLNPKGQCKQDSTTGKNLEPIYISGTGTLNNGITYKVNSDKSITLNGTGNGTTEYLKLNDTFTLPAGTYTLSNHNENVSNNGAVFYDDDGNFTTRTNVDTKTFESEVSIKPYIKVVGGTYNNFTIYPMIEAGSSMTDYEPYTNGARPNPDYPQVIHTITGDNEVVVYRKNLFDKNNVRDGYRLGSDGTYYAATGYSASELIPVKPNTTYYRNTIMNVNQPTCTYDQNQVFIERITSGRTFTTPNNCYYVRTAVPTADLDTTQLEEGNEGTSYEPYNGDTYELGLGVENLFSPTKAITDSDNEETYITQDGEWIRFKTGDQRLYYYPSIVKENTQYTFQAIVKSGVATTNAINMFAFYTDGTNASVCSVTTTDTNEHTIIGTTTSGKTLSYLRMAYTDTKEAFMKIEGTQLEEGTKANSYSPFGQTPIKMRGIGTYEDYFVRNSGKNIFSSVWEQGVVDGTSGLNADSATVIRTKDYISVVPNKHYAINRNISTGQINVRCYGANKNYLGTGTDYLTLISGSNAGNPMIANVNQCIIQPKQDVYYLRFNDTSNNLSTLYMMTEGDTQEIYEPYDNKGQWCKYNAIKEIVLDGETDGLKFTSAEISRNKRFSLILSDVLKQSYLLNVESKSNNFIYNTNVYMDSGDTIGFIINSTQLYVRFGSASELDTITKANAWLSTHNTEFVYILASPYLSPIESETLISQLDKVEKALAKQGQTNISQTNNDIPFKIYASAIRDMSDYGNSL